MDMLMSRAMRMLLAAVLISAAVAVHAQSPTDALLALPESQAAAELQKAHPATYLLYASKLFQAGKKDEAVKWFYIGEIRYRFLLSAKNTEQTDEGALFGALHAGIGQPINEWAGGAPSVWVKSIDAALDWDAANDNDYLSKDSNRAAWEKTRAGLQGLKDMIIHSHAEIRAKRSASGLENREQD